MFSGAQIIIGNLLTNYIYGHGFFFKNSPKQNLNNY